MPSNPRAVKVRPRGGRARAAASLLLALVQLSCAVSGNLTPLQSSMPAARAGLRPEYRVFFDTLLDYGDWVLIEPYGYVFRPRVNFDAWRPYGDGFWVPTDLYGWVWVSEEPFGWATYHYGRWLFDSYQGWVWAPGLDWAPAWVDWQQAGQYVGWAPLPPSGASYSNLSGGAYTYVHANDLASTDLSAHLVAAAKVRAAAAEAKPIDNETERGGVTFNRGPRLEWVERIAGPLKLAKIEDLVPPGSMDPATAGGSRDTGGSSKKSDVDPAVMQRAATKAASEAKTVSASRVAPARFSALRPFGVHEKNAARKAARGLAKSKGTEPDSTRQP